MIELIWGILNFALIFYLFYILLYSVKLIKEKFGIFASFIFVFGIMSLASSENKENDSKEFPLEKKINSEINKISSFKIIRIDKQISTSKNLFIYFKNINGSIAPVKYSSTYDGFVSGKYWDVSDINLTKVQNNTYRYKVDGTLKWRIFGLELYSQPKYYFGTVNF
ncbi:hypothetical protein [Cloacibacterium caeni]|uniref:hypothetical protein n=1 Tax=Cloacibacterium caeni TaxID=2004710 RepID=UPI001BD0C36B|nr:hypothetical protein [Cloacibacterium caeni]